MQSLLVLFRGTMNPYAPYLVAQTPKSSGDMAAQRKRSLELVARVKNRRQMAATKPLRLHTADAG